MNSILSEIKKSVSNIFNVFFKKIQSIFFKIKKGPVAAIRKSSKNLTKIVFKKESSLKDYIRIGRYFISKRLFIAVTLILFIGIFYFSKFIGGRFIFDKKLYLTDETVFSGNVKMYDTRQKNNLVYKGSLLNGQFDDDDGRLYFIEDTSVLKYTGGFKKNKLCGYGTLYGLDSIKLYEGSFENDIYEGKGTLYYPSGDKKYQGSFKNGLFSGEGTEYDSKGRKIYQGMFENNLPEGKCREYYQSGSLKYDGAFSNGQHNGIGTLYGESGSIIYSGEFKNGLYDGKGDLYENGILRFTGQFEKGRLNGYIKEYYNDQNLKYSGNTLDGRYFGEGVLYYSGDMHNKKYEGNFENEKFSGEGTLYSDNEQNTRLYSGSFKNSMYNGYGQQFDNNGVLIYEGEFKNNLYNGTGISYSDEKSRYIGEFKDGIYNGTGKLLDENEAVIYDGEFLYGSFQGFGTLYDSSGNLEFKGFFNHDNKYIEGFFNITETSLKKHLGQPDSTVVNEDSSLDLYYDSLGYIFNISLKSLDSSDMTVDSLKITSSIEIDEINTSMTYSIVHGILNEPDVKRELEAQSPDEALFEVVYYKKNYALYLVFSDYKTNMNYMQFKSYKQ